MTIQCRRLFSLIQKEVLTDAKIPSQNLTVTDVKRGEGVPANLVFIDTIISSVTYVKHNTDTIEYIRESGTEKPCISCNHVNE
ncbi:hypothetical protein NC651_020849 [Populus alba x Populus x berolinensis]|nr:hypothetical protein NC651_020849 [Populus alba x Populus x berolinensis]